MWMLRFGKKLEACKAAQARRSKHATKQAGKQTNGTQEDTTPELNERAQNQSRPEDPTTQVFQFLVPRAKNETSQIPQGWAQESRARTGHEA